MKYAMGDRINFVQFDSQFSPEIKDFLSEYAGINFAKRHKAISVICQIYMHAGNTAGYYICASKMDIIRDAQQFCVGKNDLELIYDLATKHDVFDKTLYEKHQIITNPTMQITYISAKNKSEHWNMNGEFILDFVCKYYKSQTKFAKIATKLDKFKGRFKSIEQNGSEKELNGNISDDDMTLDEFKQLHPKKCFSLPDDWVKPEGVKLSIISEAIKNSQKFLEVKNYMTLERLSTEFYKKVCAGWYDDTNYEKNIAKNEQKKSSQNFKSREYSKEQLDNLYDDLSTVEL